MVAAARKTLERAGRVDLVDIRCGDAEQLPYPDGAFDGVISTFGVMFCADPQQAAAELARVCRPGGRLVGVDGATGSGASTSTSSSKRGDRLRGLDLDLVRGP